MRILKVAILLAGALALGSCGGGGSVTTGGGGQGPVVTMPQAPGPSGVDISLIRSQDGEPAREVADYLLEHAKWGAAGIARFEAAPIVRVATGASDRERVLTVHAVALINRVLPYDQHLTFGPDAPAGVAGQWREGLPHVPDGQIFVEFTPGRTNAFPTPSAAVAHPNHEDEYDHNQERLEARRLRASGVEMESAHYRGHPDHHVVAVLVHELLHALGLADHPDHERFWPSIMSNIFPLDGSLPSIDAAGLQALYTRLGTATEPEYLVAASLGPWSRETIHLTGELGDLAFGVRHNNGESMPWTAGPEPSRPLAESGLRGSATWEGVLLGFTPELETVAGDAEIRVNLVTLTGNADFTELQQWPELEDPGGMGTRWNTGSLGYTIAVGGNYLRSTGGDDGTVSGQFYGTGHQGVAGSVEREDLTAAFGALRE